MSHTPLHLHLAHRKALAARILFLKTVEPVGLVLRARHGAGPIYDSVRDLLTAKANLALERSEDTTPLDSFLNDLGPQLDQALGTWSAEEVPAALRSALAEFAETARNICCDRCSPIRPDVCDGSERDHRIVAEAGHCIQELRDHAAFALSRAQHVYESVGCPSRIHPAVTFSTAADAGSNDPGLRAQGIGGVTVIRDDGLTHRSEVRLVIAVERFDQHSRCSVPYVLYHEVVAHAFTGIRTAGMRMQTDIDDLFAEGWMDAIAFRILEGDVEEPSDMSSDVLDAAASLRAVLEGRDCISPGAVKARHAASRRLGRVAVERAERLLIETSCGLAAARADLIKLSLMLNASRGGFDQPALDEFVLNVYHVANPPRSVEAYALGAHLFRYCETGDAEPLFNAARALQLQRNR